MFKPIGTFIEDPLPTSPEQSFITEFLEELNSAISMTSTDENMFILEQTLTGKKFNVKI